VQFDSTLMMSVPFDSTLIVGQIEESSGDRCAVARLFFFVQSHTCVLKIEASYVNKLPLLLRRLS
jgi:hypothetical protein